jgi:hypothetical protein
VVVDSVDSADPLYAALLREGDEVQRFSNVDNDVAGIVCVPLAHTTSEASLTPVTSLVSLTSQPISPVRIAYASSDTSEGVASGVVELNVDNWVAGVVITITPVDDDLADGAQLYTVVFGAAESASDDYAGMVPSFAIEVTNTDDDAVGVEVRYSSEEQPKTASSLSDNYTLPAVFCFEQGDDSGAPTSFTVEVRLTSEPFAPVSLVVKAPDAAAYAAEAAATARALPSLGAGQAVVVPVADWDQWHLLTISCADNDYATGRESFVLPLTTESDDDAYDQFDDDSLEPKGLVSE